MNEVDLPLSPFSSVTLIELGSAQEPLLQAFFEANPDYFVAMSGSLPRPQEAHDTICSMRPPPDMPYEKQWCIGFLGEAGEIEAVSSIATDVFEKGIWHIALFMVATRYQGRGYATSLYESIENWARSKNVRWLRLGVIKGNTRAERFWERHRYVEARTRENVLIRGRKNTLRLMVKSLSNGTLEEYFKIVDRDNPQR